MRATDYAEILRQLLEHEAVDLEATELAIADDPLSSDAAQLGARLLTVVFIRFYAQHAKEALLAPATSETAKLQQALNVIAGVRDVLKPFPECIDTARRYIRMRMLPDITEGLSDRERMQAERLLEL